jgi:hypothetical protein
MWRRLLEKVRPWIEAMDGADDPRGDILLNLETRVSRLEAEVSSVRSAVSSGQPKSAIPPASNDQGSGARNNSLN